MQRAIVRKNEVIYEDVPEDELPARIVLSLSQNPVQVGEVITVTAEYQRGEELIDETRPIQIMIGDDEAGQLAVLSLHHGRGKEQMKAVYPGQYPIFGLIPPGDTVLLTVEET